MMIGDNQEDAISFRIFHSDQEDNGKTIVRISSDIMKSFQIDSGDILKISGPQAAHAICLPLDTSKITQKNLPEITFLNDHVRDIPQIFASDAVFRNLLLWSGTGSNISVEKTGVTADTGNNKKTITEASKVIFATAANWFADNLGEDYQKRIDFEALHGVIITKMDRITAPIHTEDNNTRLQQFSSIILDVKPESQEGIWMIGKNTQFEFEDASLDVFSRNTPPSSGLHDLARVIPVVQKISFDEDITITVPSLEIYENATKLNIYVTERLHKIEEITMPDFHTGEERSMKRPIQRLQGIPRFNMEIHDNLGNVYSAMPYGGGGSSSSSSGSSFPSGQKDWEFYATSEMSIVLLPIIEPDVKQMTVTIKEVMWEDIMQMRLPRTKPPHMTRLEPNQMQMSIATGPWKFDIPIQQDNN